MAGRCHGTVANACVRVRVCGCVRRCACVRGCVCAHMYIPEPCSSPIAMLAVALAWYCWLPPADSCCVCTCQCRPSRECKHTNCTHTCRRQYLAQGCLVLQIPIPAAVSICCAWKTPLCGAKSTQQANDFVNRLPKLSDFRRLAKLSPHFPKHHLRQELWRFGLHLDLLCTL